MDRQDRETNYPPVPGRVTKVCDNNSVGVLIRDMAGRYLMFRRATLPVGIAPPAGHIDDHGTADDAAIAEVSEEVGLTVVSLTPIVVQWRRNICRRQYGPLGPGHNWTVYRAEVIGDVQASAAEALDADWYTSRQIQSLADRTIRYAHGWLSAEDYAEEPGLEPVWVGLLRDAGLIGVSDADLDAVETLACASPYAIETNKN